ncbi:MAG: alpha/beta hydrolase [Deltaproteobacteria bacterium]|nr:alpha/beta hydrolase [Deltaproteobacteria bacterium]
MFDRLQKLLDVGESRGAQLLTALPRSVQRALSLQAPIRIDGQELEPDLQLVLAVRKLLGSPALSAQSPPEARGRYARDMRLHRGPPIDVGPVRELVVEGLRARHYAPLEPGLRPLLLYFHGGGFVVGDLDTHDVPCRLLCREAGVHVLSVAYRLAPERPFPAAIDDARAALRWAFAHARELGASEQVAVAGDSAGANLTAVVSQLAVRDDEPAPCLQVLLYPPTDRSQPHRSLELFANGFLLTRADIDWYQAQNTGHIPDAARDPRVSPLLAKDLSGLPPAIIAVAGFDPLRDEGIAYAEALARGGTPCELLRFSGQVHGFVNLVGVAPSARAAVVEVAQRIRATLDAESRSAPPRPAATESPTG